MAGHLNLANCAWLTNLPRVLIADSIDVSNCMNLRALPERVKCDELLLARTSIVALGEGVGGCAESMPRIVFGCNTLRHCAYLNSACAGCTQLERLPESLDVRRLDVAGCTRLARLPEDAAVKLWNLDVSSCTNLATLPNGLVHLQTLNIGGCTRLTSLPDDIRIQSWIEVADSGLETLPYSLRSVRVLWRGMPVPDRVAFSPETITVDEILQEQNLEFRRVLVERMGPERFIANAHVQTLDNDLDPGGSRRLLRVPFENGEDVVCLEVHCPSTGRRVHFARTTSDANLC